jgi:glyoxylase-like metal-dependent hydrolase (beta-lactamase superfamily II)
MKRLLKIVGVLVVVLFAAVAGIIAATFLGRQSITDGAEYGRVRIVKDGIVSVGVIDLDGRHVALVDAGNDADAKAILAELSRRHLTPDAVTTVLITHGHTDHTAGLTHFPHAQVMTLDREVGAVEGREGFHGPATRLMPVRPTGVKVARALHDGETLMLGTIPVRVFAVPGHTAGSAAYLIDGVLFMGDAADVDDRGGIKPSPWVFSDSQAEDRASLVRLADRLRDERIPVSVLAFAHSGTRTDGLAQLLVYARTNE